MPGEFLQQIRKSRQDVLTLPGWPQWRTTYHITTSAWKMPPSWHWTGHSGGYWQQVELRKPNDDDDMYNCYQIHTHHFNSYFTSEPRLARCPLEVSFFMGRMPFLSPNQQCRSTEGLMASSFYRRQDAAQPTLSMHWRQAASMKCYKQNNSIQVKWTCVLCEQLRDNTIAKN